jgi:hypothetical protein
VGVCLGKKVSLRTTSLRDVVKKQIHSPYSVTKKLAVFPSNFCHHIKLRTKSKYSVKTRSSTNHEVVYTHDDSVYFGAILQQY